MSNEINFRQRIAALEKQNKQLRDALDKSSITPRMQATLYILAVRGEVSLLKFQLTGCLSNAAWRIVEKELSKQEMEQNHLSQPE